MIATEYPDAKVRETDSLLEQSAHFVHAKTPKRAVVSIPAAMLQMNYDSSTEEYSATGLD
jgi:hypothetical protein